MDTITEILTICNESLWFDYSNISELNKLHNYLIKYFYDSIPKKRLIISLNLIYKIVIKIYDNDKEEINKDIFKLGEEKLYMLSYQKTIMEDNDE